jgi:hypothetical protein
MKCSICGNALSTYKPQNIFKLKSWKQKDNNITFCSYCEWKGTTGAGEQLRNIIKEHNNETIYTH